MAEIPQSEECEMALCATILAHNPAYYEAAQIVSAEHFTHPTLRNIYQACGELIADGRAASPATLQSYFNAGEPNAELGGAFLESLVESSFMHRGAAPDLAREIKSTALRRELICFGKRLVENASTFEIGDDIDDDIAAAQAELIEIQGGIKDQRHTTAADGAWSTFDMIEKARKARDAGEVVGLPTGLDPIDKHLAGLQRKALYVLAGATSMGKTALAGGIAWHAANIGQPVLFVTQEMPTEQLMQRFFSQQTGVSVRAQQTGAVSDEELHALAEASGKIAALPFYSLDTPNATPAFITAVASQLNRIAPLGLIVVDYLQLLDSGSTGRGESRAQEVGKISRALKALAMQLDCPVLALAQLSRAVDARDDHRPKLSDLRESGTIEQDADVVLFVYRAEKYLRASPPPSDADEMAQANYATKLARESGRAEILIDKNRHGPLGELEVGFYAERMQFLSEQYKPGSGEPAQSDTEGFI